MPTNRETRTLTAGQIYAGSPGHGSREEEDLKVKKLRAQRAAQMAAAGVAPAAAPLATLQQLAQPTVMAEADFGVGASQPGVETARLGAHPATGARSVNPRRAGAVRPEALERQREIPVEPFSWVYIPGKTSRFARRARMAADSPNTAVAPATLSDAMPPENDQPVPTFDPAKSAPFGAVGDTGFRRNFTGKPGTLGGARYEDQQGNFLEGPARPDTGTGSLSEASGYGDELIPGYSQMSNAQKIAAKVKYNNDAIAQMGGVAGARPITGAPSVELPTPTTYMEDVAARNARVTRNADRDMRLHEIKNLNIPERHKAQLVKQVLANQPDLEAQDATNLQAPQVASLARQKIAGETEQARIAAAAKGETAANPYALEAFKNELGGRRDLAKLQAQQQGDMSKEQYKAYQADLDALAQNTSDAATVKAMGAELAATGLGGNKGLLLLQRVVEANPTLTGAALVKAIREQQVADAVKQQEREAAR